MIPTAFSGLPSTRLTFQWLKSKLRKIREHAAFLTSIFETGTGGDFCAVQTVKAMGGGSEYAMDLSQTAMNPHFGTSYGAFYCVSLLNQGDYVPQAPSNAGNVGKNFPMCADAVATGDAKIIQQCHDE